MGGKHRAINRGVQLAKGDLFFIVDSDDQLPSNSIETVLTYYTQIADESSFAGVCGLKYYFSGEKVGGDFPYEVLDCNAIDFRYKYNLTGDMAEVFKTSILREYPFPEFENEKNFVRRPWCGTEYHPNINYVILIRIFISVIICLMV